MTIVTSSTENLQPNEWKSNVENLSQASTSLTEWIESIRRWEILFQSDETPVISAYLFIATYALHQQSDRNLNDQFLSQYIEVGKISLKYFVEKLLRQSDGEKRILTVNCIGSWCSRQSHLTLNDLKDSIELIKTSDLPKVEDRRTRWKTDFLPNFVPSTRSKSLAEHFIDYLHQLNVDQIFGELFQILPRSSALKNDFDFLRRSLQLPIFDRFDEKFFDQTNSLPFRSLRQLIDSKTSIEEDFTLMLIQYGSILHKSKRLTRARDVYLNYHLQLSLSLIDELRKNLSEIDEYLHLLGLFLYSTGEVIGDLSHSDRSMTSNLPSTFQLTDSLQAAERYFYLKSTKIFSFLLKILRRLIDRPKICETPLVEVPVTPLNSDETYDLDNLFSEKASKSVVSHRPMSTVTTRSRTVLHRYFPWSTPNDTIDHNDEEDFLDYLDRISFNDNAPILLDDLRETLNNDEEILQIAALFERSPDFSRWIDHLLQWNLFSERSENRLLNALGVKDQGPWTKNLSHSTLILLMKILFKRDNLELIHSYWSRFLNSLTDDDDDDLSLEEIQLFLLFFHQLTLTQKKEEILHLMKLIETKSNNRTLLIIFDYLIFHFYQIPSEFAENLQKFVHRRGKNSPRTTNFNSILTKTSAEHLDSFTLKTFDASATSYHSFYLCLIDRMDFTLKNSTKALVEYLWKILGVLPPPKDYLKAIDQYKTSVHLLHRFRLEKKPKEFFPETFSMNETLKLDEIKWNASPSEFDLLVEQILFSNLSASSSILDEAFRDIFHQYDRSLNRNRYERCLALIPLRSRRTEKEKRSSLTTVTKEVQEYFQSKMKIFFEEENVRPMFLRELLQLFIELQPKIDDREIRFRILFDEDFAFLQTSPNASKLDEDHTERIYREIFQLLFDDQVPNEIVTNEILRELFEYLDEHFSVEDFQRCLTSHDLFDFLLLTSKENCSDEIFLRMISLFNRIFAHSAEFQSNLRSLRRFTELNEEIFTRWTNKFLQRPSDETKQIFQTFFKYFIQSDAQGQTLIEENSSRTFLKMFIEHADQCLRQTTDRRPSRFDDIVQLLIILVGHGAADGHRLLIEAAGRWFSSLTDRIDEEFLPGFIDLLSYFNDVLFALTKDSSTMNFSSDEDDDDEEEFSSDDQTDPSETKRTTIGEYDPNKLCTFTTTKKEYAHQHWYHCHTCKMIDRVGICQICANVCHRNHEISYAKYGSFFCDCGAKEDGSCQALVKRSSTSIPAVPLKRKEKKPSKKKKIFSNRQRRLIKQLNNDQKDLEKLFEDEQIPQSTLKFFEQFQKTLRENYQEIYNLENRFDLIDEFLRSNDRCTIECDETKSTLCNSIIHSQENALENVKFSLTNEHGQQIKQLLSTNSIRRQGMTLSIATDPSAVKQHLIISQEKGKQSMISIFQLNPLLKQCYAINSTSSTENLNKKKFPLTKLNTLNLPFTILSMQTNPLNPDYLALTGLKDCHILNLDQNGRMKEATIVLQPNLDSTGNYIIRSQWLAIEHQTHFALLTADFIKIYDLSVDPLSPIYYFLLPTGKVRDCTFYYTMRENQLCCYILIMASNGYIYYEQLTDASSARNGSFYVTNTLEIQHESITETNNNGILLGGGVSVYYSPTLKLLFWSYVQGKNFYGILDRNRVEKFSMIRSIDVKMNPSSSSNNGNKSTSTSTYHSLCAWNEIPSHPGLISAMTQMTNNPVFLFITPEHVRVNEMKIFSKTTKIQDLCGIRSDQRTSFLLLADDGSLKFVGIDPEKTNFWLKKSYLKKKFYPLIELEMLDQSVPSGSSQTYPYPQSDYETDDQDEVTTKRRKTTVAAAPPAAVPHPTSNENTAASIPFPVDFFENCQILTEYEFGGRDLLDVYNVAQIKLRLSTPGMFIANVRSAGFTLDVLNKDSENMVITGVRIHIGSYAMDKSPQYFEYFGRTLPISPHHGPRWYDLCLTRDESIQAEKKFSIVIGPSVDVNHITVIDEVKVYGKSKSDFQWPDDLDGTKSSSTLNVATEGKSPMINEYLHSFRPTNDEKDLALLSTTDRLIAYSMQVLTKSLPLVSSSLRTSLIETLQPLTSTIFHLSLPIQLQRYLRALMEEFFASSEKDFAEYLDRLQLNFISKCLAKENYLDYFYDIQTYEYLLLSLLSISRHRPHHIQRYLTLPSKSSMDLFLPSLINILFSLLNQRPSNRLLESIDRPLIDLKQIEKLLHILVDIYHSLALNESRTSQQWIIDGYIRLLTYPDYQINFLIKNALNRCMQPKIQRLISKLSTASDLNQQELSTEKSFQSIPISAQIYPNDETTRPRWTTERTNLVAPPPPPPPPPPSAPANPNDEAAMLQYALALSMADSADPSPASGTAAEQAIEYVDVDDGSVAVAAPIPPAVPPAPIDHSDNNSLYEGDDGHVSESSSTANETEGATTSTPTTIARPVAPSSSSNESTKTLKFNLNESIDASIYEERLNDFKHLFLENLINQLEEKLIENASLNGLNAIAYLQILLSLTIEFASKSDETHRKFLQWILQRLLDQMKFLHSSANFIDRTAKHEIELMLLRLLTVFVSFMLKVHPNDRDQYTQLSVLTAEQLEKSRVIDFCLHALQQVYDYLSKQPIDENLLTDSSSVPSSSSSSSSFVRMKIIGQTKLPDLSPFFYKQYTKHHCRDVFESYPELLAEISTRLPYQMKKIFDLTSPSRTFLFSSQWQECLCEYYLLPQANFLKRQIRKLLMYISGSREKYRKLRDLHVLSRNLQEIQRISQENFSSNETKKVLSKQIPYSILMKLVDHLKSSLEISVQRSINWQKFCQNDPSILHFLLQLIVVIDDALAPFILQLLINAISLPSSSTSTNNRSMKTSKSVRANEFERTDDLTICSIVVQFSKMISNDFFDEFLRLFLFQHPQQSIRWLTHTFLYHLYQNSPQTFQDHLFDLFIRFWSSIPSFGLKAFQYIDLLGFLILKNKDDQRTAKFLVQLESMLKEENQRLLTHPNASIYRRLSTILDLEQNNGYYFENEPCLICNNPDVPYQQMKLQTMKLDQRYTTQSHIIKLLQAYSIQKLQIKMSEMKRNKTVRTIRFYYNNRQVQSIVDLKNSVNCKWLLAKTIRLNNIQQTEVKIDFVIPIIACNLMIEYVDFFESPSSTHSNLTDTTTLQCPRCNSPVAATPGICPNCGENVFQCHKCRSINYDERDPFLCNSCGYCKYCKFDFIFTAKQINYVEPIESDEDRTKTLNHISQLLEKTDKIYRQLLNQKPVIEYLLTKFSSDEQLPAILSATSTSTTAPSTGTTSADPSDPSQVPPPNIPLPASTTLASSTNNGIHRIVQQIAPKYHLECRQTYDELGKLIQKIIAARKELYNYDQRHQSYSSSTAMGLFSHQRNDASEQCYGCILSTLSHCILLLRAFVLSSHRLKQTILQNHSLIDQLFLYNIRYTNQQIRHDVRLFFASLTRDHPTLTDYLTKKIFDHLQDFFQQPISFSTSSLINYDLLLLYTLIQRSNQEDQELCWESKIRLIMKIFLSSLEQTQTGPILENITLPCLRMLLHLSKPVLSSSSSSASKFMPINLDQFLSKQITYHDWIQRQSTDKASLSQRITANAWLEKLLFSSQSATIRYLTCKLIQTLATDEHEKYFILKILIQYLHCLCQEKTSKYSSEYLQLIKELLTHEQSLKFLLNHDEEFHLIEQLASLIEREIQRLHQEEDSNFSNSNLTFGYSIKSLTELLTLSLQQDQFKQKYKSILIAIVLNGYLSLKKLIIQRTKLIDEAQTKMLELLEQMTRGNEQETRQFMMICINTIEKFPMNDMQTPQFIFERLCNLIYPEETMQGNKEFFIVVEKDPNQEDFLQGRMMGNPYSSTDPSMGPLMRDIKNKICTDCELIALLEDDNGMELLVANKIINLGLAVRDVYKKVWLPYINAHQSSSSGTAEATNNDHEPMHIVYRMRGLLGDATEDIIETFETKKTNGDNGEDDPEEIYHLADVLSEHAGLETMLKRLDSIRELSSGKALFEVLLKLFEYAIKLKVNRQRLIDPKLRAIGSMLDKLNLLLKTEIEEQGRDQVLLGLTERLLSLMDQLFHEASTTLSQDRYNEFSVSCEGDIEQLRSLLNYIKLPFVKSHPTLMQALIHLLPYLSFGNKEKMQTLLDYFKSYLEFDRFDNEQSNASTSTLDNDNQLHLDCFCEICKHLDKKSIYGKEFRDLVNEPQGIIDQCIAYIEKNAPPVKTYLGMQDQDSWKEFLNKPSLSYVLRLLTGLSSGHQSIQMKVALSLIPVLHKIEQLTTAGKVGVLAEDLLHSLTENDQVAKKIEEVRNQTRAEKKRLAQEARDRKMRELNLNKTARAKPSVEPAAAAQAAELTDETGHVCCICREGYKYFPNKVLAIYTFTKKVDIEPYEGKTRKTQGYTTVTHFNIIHIDCHTSAIKQARSRDEWESALLQNANTRCNGLLPLWGPDVPEAQFTTALARYDANIVEGTGIRETSATLSIHDMKLLLLRFAELQSFSEDTGGGGRESNVRLIPYQLHAILYVLTTSRQIDREEKLLQNYLARPEPTINEAFEVDGPYVMTTLALILMKPTDWDKHRLAFLQRLLVTAHVRAVNTPNDRTRLTSKTLKPFASYRTALIFFGLIQAFFSYLLKPMLDTTSTLPYHQQLAQCLRNNDAHIMEACTRILKHFEQDLLAQQSFDGFFAVLDLSNLSEQWFQQIINGL